MEAPGLSSDTIGQLKDPHINPFSANSSNAYKCCIVSHFIMEVQLSVGLGISGTPPVGSN